MAETKHTRHCKICGTEFNTNKSFQIICSSTCRKINDQKEKQKSAKAKRHKSYGLDMSNRKCMHCETTFTPKRIDSFFCSDSCRCKSHRLKRIKKHQEQNNICYFEGCTKHVYLKNFCHAHYKASKYTKKESQQKECLHCKSAFIAKSNAKKFCSTKCSQTYRQRLLGVKPAHRVAKAICNGCGKEFQPKKTEFSTYCSRKCFFTTQKSNQRTENEKTILKTCAKRRKQRMKANGYEPINKTKVFERDKWTCHICGCKTPKSKKGTMAMNSPELDHIVPIASGGSHTYSNVACSCKRCNIRKSTKPLGQLNFGII